MKKLTLVVHASVQQDLADTLRSLPQVSGFTFIHVEGHSTHTPEDAFLSARDKVVGFVPRVRVDVLLADEDVARVLAAVRATRAGISEHGIYWVTAVEEGGQL